MQRFVSVLMASALAATASAQFPLVTPNGYASTVGNTNNTFPWARNAASMRIQFLIDSTHFTSQGVVSPIIISQLRYRPYPGAVTSWAGGSWPNVRIDMATSPLDWASASTTFANNLGPDLTTVLNGPVTVNGGSTLGVGVVVPWHITIPLTTPFIYDPTSGNDLTVDIYLDGTGWTGVSRAADHVTGAPVTGSALGCRVYDTTGLTGTTGTITSAYGAVTEFTYLPANGLFAGFSSNVTGGASPLAVTYTNSSFSSDPGGITSYAWDFDGDSVIDSTVANPPPFVYANCGTYTVSLTVTDATHPPSTLTRTNYIHTDVIQANFTAQVVGPLTVQFTDTSNMPATSWAWDLDGDSIVDSNAQNPVFVYPNPNAVNVTLTTTRLCSAPSVITKQVIPLQTLTTNLAVNNGVGTPATLYFNLNVLNPLGVNINAFDTITQTISTPFTCDWFMKIGTYVGSELNPAPWTQVGTASGTTASVANLPALATFPQALHIPQGSYGCALRYVGAYPRYVTLTALTTYANGDLSLTAGAASLSTAGPFTGTNLNSPRGWAGTLYYGTNNVTGLAGYGWFGPGCNGTLGKISVTNTTQPTIGGTLSTNLNNLQFGIAVMVVGLSNTLSGGVIPLPLDLGLLGAPGCPLRVSLDVTDTVIGAGTSAPWNFNIPNQINLMGFQLYNQAASLDSINAFGFAMSDAYGWVVGN